MLGRHNAVDMAGIYREEAVVFCKTTVCYKTLFYKTPQMLHNATPCIFLAEVFNFLSSTSCVKFVGLQISQVLGT